MYVPLSENINSNGVMLTLKWSKGCDKIIHVGAHEEFKVSKLCFKVTNPRNKIGRWNLKITGTTAVFQQSETGDIILPIQSNISLKCTESLEPTDTYPYLKSKFRRYLGKGTSEEFERYIHFIKTDQKHY